MGDVGDWPRKPMSIEVRVILAAEMQHCFATAIRGQQDLCQVR